MILSFLLVVFTLTVAVYSLRAACIVNTLHSDTRPLLMAFFLLMSLAVLEVTLALSPEVTMLSSYFVTIWVSIEMLLVGCVGWLIVLFSLPRQTSSVKSEGIINE